MSSVDNSVVNPTGHSRKRLKMSRGEPTTGSTPKPSPLATAPMVAPASESAVAVAACRDGACQHETMLVALQTDLDAMRHLVTCQICHRLMYEPFTLSCGHSYCYSCLSQWLGGNRRGTCPDCRTDIYQQPTPSYIIRELALLFATRSHLLTDGDTLEEHNAMAKEEAEIVAKDKSNTDSRTGGLFKGIFKGIFNRRGRLLPLHDPSDDVDRCPDCQWEIEDGYCNNCGQPVGDGFSDYDGDSVTDEDLDHDLSEHDHDIAFDPPNGDIGAFMDRVIEPDDDDDDDDHDSEVDHDIFAAAFGFGDSGRRARRGLVPIHTRTFTPEDELDESDDYEHDSEMEGFIDDDEPHTEEESHADTYDSDRTEVQELAAHTQPRRRNIVINFSEDEQDEAGQTGPIAVDDSDDDGPLAAAAQRNVRSRNVPRQRAIAISSDEEDSGADIGHTNNNANENESESESENETENGIENGTEYGTENERESEAEDDRGGVGDTDAESPPDYLLPTGDRYDSFDDDASEQTSSDRHGDDSDNGWGLDTRAALPLATQEPRHHLGTGMQHRRRCARRQPTWPIPRARPSDTLMPGLVRLFEVPLGTFESAPAPRIQPFLAPPTARLPPTNRSATQRSHLANVPSRVNHGRPRPTAAPIRSMSGPTPMGGPLPHPFYLSDTLGRINDQNQHQPRHPASRRSLADHSRSSSAGGVHLRSNSSESASDGSQTIGVSTNQNGKRTMEPVSGRLASHSTSRRV